MGKVRLALAIHNHQPIGNFDGVFEAAYQDSYRPFLELLEKYPRIPFSLHTSGCLLEWLVEHKPEYIERLKAMVAAGQVEIVGGGYYEPILAMIPSRDRQGQIRGYTEFLRDTFGAPVRGMWVPERVWEQSLVADIAQSGIEYSILDDYHFRKAGLRPGDLHGYFLTEDAGELLRVFPGSEPLRYLIPFQEVGRTIDYLREVSQRHENALVVFADDGEKFGTWPETKAHVYEHGWLARFLDGLVRNLDWIDVVTLGGALDALEPIGKVYLPDCSYREMTEWALPAERLIEFDRLWHRLDHQTDGGAIKEYLKGGFWRNFKVKYPETNEMYARMMEVSQRLERLCAQCPGALGDHRVNEARQALYRGQCNCAYWHGAFGGLYLPHLRNAVYSQLIDAENRLLEYERGKGAEFVGAQTRDFDFDGLPEVRLENDQLAAYFSPARGGHLYELDVRSFRVNLGASLSRRPEAYHEKILHAQLYSKDGVGSIHDRVVFKQEGLDKKLNYDWYPRKSFVDHFFAPGVSLDAVVQGTAVELGDFVTGRYRSTVSQTGDQSFVLLSRRGRVDGHELGVAKKTTLAANQRQFWTRYRIDNLPQDRPLCFAIEFNFAALAAGADDRYFRAADGQRIAPLGRVVDLESASELALVDEWIGIDVGLGVSRPAGIWSFPIESVSQSEGGFESVHQSVCVLLHWEIPAGRGGSADDWEVDVRLSVNPVRDGSESETFTESAVSME